MPLAYGWFGYLTLVHMWRRLGIDSFNQQTQAEHSEWQVGFKEILKIHKYETVIWENNLLLIAQILAELCKDPRNQQPKSEIIFSVSNSVNYTVIQNWFWVWNFKACLIFTSLNESKTKENKIENVLKKLKKVKPKQTY